MSRVSGFFQIWQTLVVKIAPVGARHPADSKRLHNCEDDSA